MKTAVKKHGTVRQWRLSITNQSTVNKIMEWLTNKGFLEEVGERFEHKQAPECPVFICTETQ